MSAARPTASESPRTLRRARLRAGLEVLESSGPTLSRKPAADAWELRQLVRPAVDLAAHSKCLALRMDHDLAVRELEGGAGWPDQDHIDSGPGRVSESHTAIRNQCEGPEEPHRGATLGEVVPIDGQRNLPGVHDRDRKS